MSTNLITSVSACRVCGCEDLIPVFSLGDQYVVNFIDSEDQEQHEAPLDMVLCDTGKGGCGLLQLRHTFSQPLMYSHYWYRSGVNNTMRNELSNVVKTAKELVDLKSGDFVIDIGSNDSTLLRFYDVPGLKRVGFEPAKNLVEKYGMEGVDKVITDYFNFPKWGEAFGDAKAKVITAIAMFYDLERPNEFVSDVAKCLHPEGVFIVQQNYLPYMLEKNVIDNVAHEHLEYYSLTTCNFLMEKHGLEVFDVQLNDVNGGSMRTFVKHKNSEKGVKETPEGRERVRSVLEKEKEAKLLDKETYEKFIERVFAIRDKITDFIAKEKESGKKIYVYGASTRGNALLQCFGIDYKLITAAADKNPDKWGKKMVGTLIPIISEKQARAEHPDYFFILPWQFLEEFKKREEEFLKRGGKFIVPLPEFRILGFEDAK